MGIERLGHFHLFRFASFIRLSSSWWWLSPSGLGPRSCSWLWLWLWLCWYSFSSSSYLFSVVVVVVVVDFFHDATYLGL